MPSRIVHMQLSVRGALMNYRTRDYAKMFTDPATGRYLTPREAKAALLDELAKGHEVLPIGGPCEGFDYINGCPGHDAPAPAGSGATRD